MPQTESQRRYNERRAAAARNQAVARRPHAEIVEERSELSALRAEVRQLVEERDAALALVDRFAQVKPADLRVPSWVAPKATTRRHRATPVLMLSDLHLDEVVDLYEMDGMNEYSREIAERRLQRVIDFTVEFCQRYTGNLTYDGIVVPLLGDIITGSIHPELAKTNEAPEPATIVHWVPILASALTYLADVFGHVHVPTVDGNHDRTTHKIETKRRAESSYAWIVYNWLADTLRNDPRITFSISVAPEQIITIHNTRFLLTHGDGFRSSGGVGGIYPSMAKFLHRKHELYAQVGKGWDVALMGHWHQLLWGSDFVVNGSLKGYDQYAKHGGFRFEKARQALFIVTPERGITTQTAVYADPA